MLKRAFPRVLLLGLALAVAGVAVAVEPPNLSLRKQLVKSYVESGEYAKDITRVSLEASQFLTKRAAKLKAKGQKVAVVFDIDETTLTNYPHILENDFGYVPRIWDEWVAEGRAHAIIPVQAIYDMAVRAGVDVFFVTGRKESDRRGTERNLREVGYETWTKIYYKPDSAKSTAAFKTAIRKQLTAEGYVIIVNIGDQLSDLEGGHALRAFKLPNPFYLIK